VVIVVYVRGRIICVGEKWESGVGVEKGGKMIIMMCGIIV
jgi:hypothetical protein